MKDLARDLAALAGACCLVTAAVLVALPLGLAIAGVLLIAAAVLTAEKGGTHDGDS